MLIFRLTAPAGLTWSHGGSDGAELALMAFYGGIAHPPGYGLYLTGGWLITRLPFAPLAALLVWYSLITASVACLLTGLSTHLLLAKHSSQRDPVPILTTMLVLGLSFSFWSQAIIIEVYALMACLFSALLALSLAPNRPAWNFLLTAHLFGLALTHHLTALLWLPGLLLLIGHRLPTRLWLGMGLSFVLGLWPYAYLLVRAGQVPFANWGGIETGFQAFWDHLSSGIYRAYLEPISLQGLLGGISEWVVGLPQDLAVIGLLLALVGVLSLWQRRDPSGSLWNRRALAAMLIWCIAISAFTGIYDAKATEGPYRLPLTIILAILAGIGSARLARPLRPFVLLTTVALLLLTHYAKVDLSMDRAVADFIAETEALLPEKAVVIAGSDERTFALWYAHFVEGIGPDWILVDRNLAQFTWYQANMARVYPALPPPTLPLDAWLRDLPAAYVDYTVASDVMMLPPPGYRSQRAGSWMVLVPQS
ncbi:MAG: DUF2723 domain-containing protein [Chloroflexi bacterium]|nr:DUF2723 domain-containing protein [Chloroflexota bacterium]